MYYCPFVLFGLFCIWVFSSFYVYHQANSADFSFPRKIEVKVIRVQMMMLHHFRTLLQADLSTFSLFGTSLSVASVDIERSNSEKVIVIVCKHVFSMSRSIFPNIHLSFSSQNSKRLYRKRYNTVWFWGWSKILFV